jgi:hypothetical protein
MITGKEHLKHVKKYWKLRSQIDNNKSVEDRMNKMRMKIYKISQDVNNDWDTFDSAVVIAASKGEAQVMVPDENDIDGRGWCDPENVNVEYLGLAAAKHHKKCVIVSSFNAG